MKLYRGIKAKEVQLYSPSVQAKVWDLWLAILRKRAAGDFSYPIKQDSEVRELEKLNRLVYQHFTDDKQTALDYAKRENGAVLQIDISLEDLKKYFMLEFQNFSKRKKNFEIVYIVKGNDLYRHAKTWKLKAGS